MLVLKNNNATISDSTVQINTGCFAVLTRSTMSISSSNFLLISDQVKLCSVDIYSSIIFNKCEFYTNYNLDIPSGVCISFIDCIFGSGFLQAIVNIPCQLSDTYTTNSQCFIRTSSPVKIALTRSYTTNLQSVRSGSIATAKITKTYSYIVPVLATFISIVVLMSLLCGYFILRHKLTDHSIEDELDVD